MPRFPLIDAHVHLYDPAVIRIGWLDEVPKINKRHGPSEYVRHTEGVSIEGFVFVEVNVDPGLHMAEARWVEGQGVEEDRLLGIVAAMPMEQGARSVEADLDAFARLPHARGVRRLLQGHEGEPGWALRPPFVEAVRLLASYDLSFDLCLRHGQLQEATSLVRRCPEVRFVLDHIGKPDIKSGLSQPWRADIRRLAAEPNVVCKISGVVTEADHAAWTDDEVAPYIDHAIDCFGFRRVIFGGDWPVSELATSYPRWVAVVDRVTEGASDEELRWLYRDTACSTYRLRTSGAGQRPGRGLKQLHGDN